MSTLLDKFEEHEKEFISVPETLNLIMKATKGTLEQAKDYLLVIKLNEHVPVLYRDEKRFQFKSKHNDVDGNGFNSTYSALTSELKGNEYFSIKALNEFRPLDEYDIFAHKRGYHYVAQHSVGRFDAGEFVIDLLDEERADWLLDKGAIKKVTIKEIADKESRKVKFLTSQLADARAQLVAEQASIAIKSEDIENPIDRRMEENRRKYIAVNDFVNSLSKGGNPKEGGSCGAGNPLRITVEEILEKTPLNNVNLYKLRGTEYLLVSQADKFKYKNAAEILRSFYDILDDDQTGTVKSDRVPFEGFYFKYSEVGYLIGLDSKTLEIEDAELRTNKEMSTSQPKYDDEVSEQTVEKIKRMAADYEELSLKYESIDTQNKELLENLDSALKQIKELDALDIDTEQLSDNTAKDYQVTIGILLELLQTSRGFDKEGKANRAPFLTQNDIITAITDQIIPNQGKTKIGIRFASSNVALAGAKKKREDRLDLADKINRKASSN